MTFGEKVRSLRKEKKMSQQELASMVGVSYRTIRSWEVEGRFPKQNVLYQKLADALQCDVSYLMSENEAFITEASEQFGNRGARQAQQILEQASLARTPASGRPRVKKRNRPTSSIPSTKVRIPLASGGMGRAA